MAVNNALNITETGLVTHDGSGGFTGSTVTEGGVLLAGGSNSVTDTGVLTTGTLLVGDGAGAPTELPVGSDGKVLTAASGESAGVEWATASGSGEGWAFLSSATASDSASLYFDSSIDSTYLLYAFILDHLIPATDAQDFYIRTSSDGGSSYDSGTNNYSYEDNVDAGGEGNTRLVFHPQVLNNGDGVGGMIFMYAPSEASNTLFTWATGFRLADNTYSRSAGAGERNSAADVDAVQFKFDSGNITSGTIRLYGCAKPS